MNFPKTFEHSDKYQDGKYEYKPIILNNEVFDKLPKYKILSESEWRAIGIVQTKGWVHYSFFRPEPHILLFRRILGTDPITGKVKLESDV